MSKKKLIELEIERGEPQVTKHFKRWAVNISSGKLRAFEDAGLMGARPDVRDCDVQRFGKKTVKYWGGTHTFESVDVAARSHEEALESGAALLGVNFWPFDPKKVAKFYSGNWRIVDVSKEKDRSILHRLNLGSKPKGFLIVGNGRTAGLLFQTKAQALNHLLLINGQKPLNILIDSFLAKYVKHPRYEDEDAYLKGSFVMETRDVVFFDLHFPKGDGESYEKTGVMFLFNDSHTSTAKMRVTKKGKRIKLGEIEDVQGTDLFRVANYFSKNERAFLLNKVAPFWETHLKENKL